MRQIVEKFRFSLNAGTIGGSTAISSSGNLVTTGTVQGAVVAATNLRVFNGANYVQLAAPALGSNVNFSLPAIDGAGMAIWTAATLGDCTGTRAIGTVCADGTVYAGLSPDAGGVQMFTARCDFDQTWNGTTCTGSRMPRTWNNGTTNWTTTGFASLFTGKANSAGLSALVDAGSTHYAARGCEDLDEGGHTDWYLPALNEFNVLHVNKTTIRRFDTTGTRYWTSSELNNSIGLGIQFSTGYVNDGDDGFKQDQQLVGAVRAEMIH
ncbi:MAG: hypothetical protein JNM39_04485 [Bdellovibrionaceae bacterium]|nr:hypothetical protein [Pseudobdellovibrionaceae bacterium]